MNTRSEIQMMNIFEREGWYESKVLELESKLRGQEESRKNAEIGFKIMKEKCLTLKEALSWCLEYIDTIPSDVASKFPAMPGFCRDYVNTLLEGK